MAKALYRKYRSKNFAEVVGQDHITKTLINAIKNGSVSHAYLLTGPRGVGKTSVARIIAHAVNDLPYSDDTQHIDIIEIDAASNRRIDEIRELRDKVNIAPASAKYKVYIIDEVHMLTREAFNALLKTLEEPPAHTIFILATTEPYKLPETIISRTQRLSFRPIDKEVAKNHLKQLAKKEKIIVSDGALELIAEHGQGSFRDSISILDQLSAADEKITEDMVRSSLGLPAESAVSNILESIKRGNSSEVLTRLNDLAAGGVASAAIAQELSRQLRDLLVEGDSGIWITELLRSLLSVSASVQPSISLEIALLEAANKNESQPLVESKNITKPKSAPLKSNNLVTLNENEKITDEYFYEYYWPRVIELTKKRVPSLYSVLRLAQPQFTDNKLILNFQFALHKKKLDSIKQRSLLGDIIEEITDCNVVIECALSKKADVTEGSDKPKPVAIVDQQLQTISNIFGASEVLES